MDGQRRGRQRLAQKTAQDRRQQIQAGGRNGISARARNLGIGSKRLGILEDHYRAVVSTGTEGAHYAFRLKDRTEGRQIQNDQQLRPRSKASWLRGENTNLGAGGSHS